MSEGQAKEQVKANFILTLKCLPSPQIQCTMTPCQDTWIPSDISPLVLTALYLPLIA